MDSITTETITLGDIRALRREAGAAGDTSMCRLCDRAEMGLHDPDRTWNPAPFDGPDVLEALDVCIDAINAARRRDMTRREQIISLENWLTGLGNDARYADLRRQYGDFSAAVLRHLRGCAEIQRRGGNHT